MKKLFFSLVLCAFAFMAEAQESQTLHNFLRLPVSSHASALGGENISIIEDDATLALHNPALLQSVESRGLSLGYMKYMGGSNVFSATYAMPVGEKATVGIAVQYANYGKMKQTNMMGEVLGDFSASDLAIEGILSYPLADRLVGGVTAKFIYSNIADYNSVSAGVDLGLNYYDSENDFSASIAVKNIGGQLYAYNDEFEKMPSDLQLGVSKRLIGTPFRISVTGTDLTHWDYSFFRHLTIGADILLSKQIYVAAGYNLRRAKEMSVVEKDSFGEDEEKSHGAGLTLGGGIQLERFKLHVSYGKYHVSSSSVLMNVAFAF